MARDLVVTENITVDSVIDAAGDWFLPSGADDARDVGELREVEEQLRLRADAVLLGRLTFDAFWSYWPNQTDDQTGVSAFLDQVDKFVVSSTLDEPGWEHTRILRGDLVEEVTALKRRPGGDIVATGSIRLVHALGDAGLVDEYRLFVYPAVVGRGRRLFDTPSAPPRLELVEAHPFASGIVLLRYRTC